MVGVVEADGEHLPWCRDGGVEPHRGDLPVRRSTDALLGEAVELSGAWHPRHRVGEGFVGGEPTEVVVVTIELNGGPTGDVDDAEQLRLHSLVIM